MERRFTDNFGAFKILVMEREGVRSTLPCPATLIDLPRLQVWLWYPNSAIRFKRHWKSRSYGSVSLESIRQHPETVFSALKVTETRHLPD